MVGSPGQVAADKAVDTVLVGVDRIADRDSVAVHTDTAGLVDHIAAADTVLDS